MRFIVFDLEATCDDGVRDFDNEIIEIGAVQFENKLMVGEFQSFIHPKVNPELTPFCKKLTSITQKDVDKADSFPTVLKRFLDWTGRHPVFCSWGFYDKKQMIKDCTRYDLKCDFIYNHISLKHLFHKVHKAHPVPAKGVGMDAALRMLNIPLTGSHHRGIDDARNISKIFLKYYDSWMV